MPDPSCATWSGPNSIQPDDDGLAATGTTGSTRELRTRSPSPAAPRIESLFSRDGAPPQQTIVVWDPGRAWSTFSLTQLSAGPGAPRLHRVLLRQEGAREPLAEFLVTWLPGGSEAKGWGVVEVLTAPGDPLGTRIALTLLEQADRAVLLAGGAGDKDLMRRIGDFVRSAQWDGPSLLMVSPADKPSRADRLRRGSWPRGLRVHVLEVFASPEPSWTQQLLAMVLGDGAPQEDSPAPSGEPWAKTLPTGAPTAAPRAMPGTRAGTSTRATPVGAQATAALRDLPSAGSDADPLRAALALAARAPGVLACALLDAADGEVLASLGPAQVANDAARCAARMWQAQGNAATELGWSTATCHHVVLPVGRQRPQLLLAVADREFGEPASVRWHLAVARNHLT